MPRRSAKPPRKERRFKRSDPINNSNARILRTRVLIIGEGPTEKCYFEAIIKKFKLREKHITITYSVCGSAPMKVAESTDKEIEKAKSNGNPYDYVFCVFDGDREEGLKEACAQILQTCKKEEMKNKKDALARSWPCFEYWLILHFNDSSSPFERKGKKSSSDVCESKLRNTYHPNYKKANLKCLKVYMDKTKLQTAIANGKRSRQRAQTDGANNPSSEVYKVLECLKELKKTNKLPSAS